MRKLIIFLVILGLAIFFAWRHYIVRGKLQEYIDLNYKKSWAPPVQMHLANFFFIACRYKRAAEGYERVVKRYPKSEYFTKAMFRLANCYEHLGDVKKARETYKKLVELAPDSHFGTVAQRKLQWLGS
jgi:TolA-binding protein